MKKIVCKNNCEMMTVQTELIDALKNRVKQLENELWQKRYINCKHTPMGRVIALTPPPMGKLVVMK